MELIEDVTKIPGFKFWGEDEEEDKLIWNAMIAYTFRDTLGSKEDEEAFAYLQ